jgi:hypothetical protein
MSATTTISPLRILLISCVRSGSRGVRRKNLILGQPLFHSLRYELRAGYAKSAISMIRPVITGREERPLAERLARFARRATWLTPFGNKSYTDQINHGCLCLDCFIASPTPCPSDRASGTCCWLRFTPSGRHRRQSSGLGPPARPAAIGRTPARRRAASSRSGASPVEPPCP